MPRKLLDAICYEEAFDKALGELLDTAGDFKKVVKKAKISLEEELATIGVEVG